MDTHQAYTILGLQPGASKDEINAAFRKLAKEHHPDRNPGNAEAEAKFKEINSAHQFLQNPPPQNSNKYQYHNYNYNSVFNVNFEDLFQNNYKNNRQEPKVTAHIDFVESVIGCQKDFEYDIFDMCSDCRGLAKKITNDVCTSCNGAGFISKGNFYRDGALNFQMQCNKCVGTGRRVEPCLPCNGEGVISVKKNITVKIPQGVKDKDNIVARGGGNFHYMGNMGSGYGSLSINVNVKKDPEMSLEGKDVVSKIEISLLDALKGTSKTVRTIKGEMNLKIKPCIRNSDIVRVKGYGIPNLGDHIFVIDVKYPDDISKIINVLEEKQD
jgi:molecular chaperone DnaJ